MRSTIAIALAIAFGAGIAARPQDQVKKAEPPFAVEFEKLKAALSNIDEDAENARKGFANAKTEQEKEVFQEKAAASLISHQAALSSKALELVLPHAQDPAAVEVLTW